MRVPILAVLLALSSCSGPDASAPPASAPPRAIAHAFAADGAPAVLDIPARSQAPGHPDEGWCAETALQEALLYYGRDVSQADINRAGKPRHPDLYWDDVPVAMRALGLRASRWHGRGGLDAFTRWAQKHVAAGAPIIAGVKLYPTQHPRWGLDHIVLIVGVDDDGSMLINTTWGYRVRRTRAQLASTRRGISLTNRSGRQFAYAITGLDTGSSPPKARRGHPAPR